KTNKNKPVLYFYRIGNDFTGVAVQVFAGFQGKCFLVKRTGHLGFAAFGADQTAGQDHLHFVRTKVLAGIPFISSGKVEYRYLKVLVLDASASVFRELLHGGGFEPGSS